MCVLIVVVVVVVVVVSVALALVVFDELVNVLIGGSATRASSRRRSSTSFAKK